MQVHGFARNVDWAVGGAGGDPSKPTVTLVLKDTDYTRAMWPHAFKVSGGAMSCADAGIDD
jgi:glucose-6-phosphate 1-epimerase